MRMVITVMLAAVLTATGLLAPAQARTAPKVTAAEVYLIDATEGTVRFAKRETRRVPVASLAKVMTAYVVRKVAPLTDVVTVSASDVRHAVSGGATRAGLRAGERLTVRDLLYAMLLPSGADASQALARRYGPGVGRFVSRMNAAARSLGMKDTWYTNADGLPQTGGDRSTARDQVLLAQAALRDPVIAAIVGTERHAVAKTRAHRAHVWRNTNELVPDEAFGVKTGYTRAAGHCLMFAAERDGHVLIGVVLGDTGPAARFRTARRLLDAVAAT
ncbi:D-alanyl-D-alanine carboxypeptidase family protein [Sphaerisporangium aureirubrum]|uniref:D-alanyl-D-alanine carboxypeptidase family protein n=1 Tax=Sphaerisporangium aureirubrum TaxID=1544736 RepID=A0ABW1NNZ1_9ACTN